MDVQFKLEQQHFLLQTLGVMLSAILCIIILLPSTVEAASLLKVDSTPHPEGELITLRFDEALDLVLSGNNTRALKLSANDPVYNDALLPESRLIRSIEQDGNTLVINCIEPVSAHLQSAGAGTFLLFIRLAGTMPGERDQSQPDRAQSSENPVPVYDRDLEGQSGSDLLDLARLRTMQGRLDDARDLASQIPEGTDEYPWGQLVLGEIASQEGDSRAAITHFEEALKHEETEAAAATNLALYHQQKGEPGKSQQMWERVLSLHDAGVSGYGNGSDGDVAGELTSDPQPNDPENERTGSNLKFDSSSPVELFDSKLIIAVALFLFIGGGIASYFMFLQSRRSKSKAKVDVAKGGEGVEDETFWEAGELTEEGTGSLEAELQKSKEANGKGESDSKNMDVSEETRLRLVEMHKQSNSIREMAEITGMSQDIIRMALQMEGVAVND